MLMDAGNPMNACLLERIKMVFHATGNALLHVKKQMTCIVMEVHYQMDVKVPIFAYIQEKHRLEEIFLAMTVRHFVQ